MTTDTTASALQKSKRLMPRYYPSRKKWIVDLPPYMNAGHRMQKHFSSQTDAMRWCAQHSIQTQLGLIKDRVERSSSSTLVAGLVDLYLHEKELKGLKPDGIKQAKTCLRRFSTFFGDRSPSEVDPDSLQNWLDSLNHSVRTVFNHYAHVRQFYNWKTVRRLSGVSPILEIDTPPKTDKEARKMILTPQQMRDLLKLDVEPWIRCKFVLGAFAGLRTIELSRMSYDCIDEEFNEINVNKHQSKGGAAMRPRSITLQPAVLRNLPMGKGPLIGASKEWRCHRGMPAEARIGFDRFPQNALRHSFASYHLAHFRDASKTAFELGHVSARLVYETYANSVSRRDAAIWWSL